ncbi:MAG TPA: hypothetical protein VLG72_01675 [Nitrospirota bacterium]|nr:hypothetical protein [Nitrospirota bacterium]
MTDVLKRFLLNYIPIVVARDAPGTLPIYGAMKEGLMKHERK